MSGHQRYTCSTPSEASEAESWSSGSWSTPETAGSSCCWSWDSRSTTRASTTETDDDDVHDDGHRRRLKRSPASLPVRRSRASIPSCSWVLLNRAGARRDDFRRDRTTSAISRTSKGEEISVSFELVETPGTSVLTVDWTRPSTATPGNVIAAHRDVVLLSTTMTSYENTYPSDLFVYRATSDDDPSRRGRPSLSLLPSAGRPEIYLPLLTDTGGALGIMSCTSNDDDSPSFVVAQLVMTLGATNRVRLFRSWSGRWEIFQNLPVHGANGGSDLCWSTTDAVVPYGRSMVWVDYYRGMVLMDLSSSHTQSSETNPPLTPRLQYVQLPVDRVEDPEDMEFGGRGCPKASRRVCVTRHGVKFVSVDTQHCSNFGVGHHHVLKWSHRFRITTWSLREDDDDDGGYTWTKDLTMHEQEFWDAFDGGDQFPFPHVQPEFPVVDVDNPDVVVFRLAKRGRCHRDEPKWMIQVDLRNKVLLAATAYSKKKSDGLSSAADDAQDINSARIKSGFDPIPTELPRYMDGEQACKKRRQ